MNKLRSGEVGTGRRGVRFRGKKERGGGGDIKRREGVGSEEIREGGK